MHLFPTCGGRSLALTCQKPPARHHKGRVTPPPPPPVRTIGVWFPMRHGTQHTALDCSVDPMRLVYAIGSTCRSAEGSGGIWGVRVPLPQLQSVAQHVEQLFHGLGPPQGHWGGRLQVPAFASIRQWCPGCGPWLHTLSFAVFRISSSRSADSTPARVTACRKQTKSRVPTSMMSTLGGRRGGQSALFSESRVRLV